MNQPAREARAQQARGPTRRPSASREIARAILETVVQVTPSLIATLGAAPVARNGGGFVTSGRLSGLRASGTLVAGHALRRWGRHSRLYRFANPIVRLPLSAR